MSTNDTEVPSTSDGGALPNLFKRSFNQLDGEGEAAGSSLSSSAASSDRHKRARSEPRSEAGASHVEAGINTTDSSAEPDSFSATLEQLAAMPGPSHSDHVDSPQRDPAFPSQYELSMARFNNFDEQIQPLREAEPAVERRSPPPSENPHDEDEIMEQLFAESARSSQAWREHRAPESDLPGSSYVPYASLPPPEEVIEIAAPRRSAEREREVVVIEDSDDEVQIVDPPRRPPPATPVNPRPSTDMPRAADTWSGHWDTWNAGRNPWLDAPERPPPTRVRHESLPSVQPRDRPQPFIPSPSTERRTRLQSFNDSSANRVLSPWGATYTPPSSLSLTAEEQEMFRLRRLEDARRRVHEHRSELFDRDPNVDEVLRRIRDASDRALSPFTIEDIRPRPRNGDPRPASPRTSVWSGRAAGRSGPSSSDVGADARASRLEALRSATERGNARIAELLASMEHHSPPDPAPSSTSRVPRSTYNATANPDPMRRSLVMEQTFHDNPDLVEPWGSTSRRPTISEIINSAAPLPPSPTSANRPNSPQTARRNDRQPNTRSAPSRPPSWLTSPPVFGSSEVRARNPAVTPSSSDSSIASFVTADTSFEDGLSSEQAASTAAAHAPAVSSPLRESYRAASPALTFSAPSTQPAAASSTGNAVVGGVDVNDIMSRVQSLSGLLADMTSSPQTSDALREAAARLITSGQELIRAVDDERQTSSTRNAPPSASGPSGDAGSSSASSGSSTVRATAGGRVRPPSPTSVSASLGLAPGRHPGTGARLRPFPSLATAPRAATNRNTRERLRHYINLSESWGPADRDHIRDILLGRDDTGSPDSRNLPNVPEGSSSLENAANEERRRVVQVDNRWTYDDRWTQARQYRHELQDALLAEESRLRSLQQMGGRNPPLPDLYPGEAEVDARMDVDSEDEVEVLFNSGAFEGQEAMDVDREENLSASRRTPVPAPSPSRSSNNTASRTVLRPPTAQSRASPLSLGNNNPPQPRPSATATAPHQVIDLSAYHDGPFRSALARAVEASRQSEQNRMQAAHVSQPQGRATPSHVAQAEASGSSSSNVPRSRVRLVNLLNSDSRSSQPTPTATATAATPTPPVPPRNERWAVEGEYRSLGTFMDETRARNMRLARQEALQRLVRGSGGSQGRDWLVLPRRDGNRVRQASTFEPLPNNPTGNTQNVGSGTGGRRHVPEYMDFLALSEDAFLRPGSAARLGRRGVPQNIIDSLERGTYNAWSDADTEKQCPICFEDYEASDVVLRLPKCKHWFHKPCIEEWFKTASTCPICRDHVGESSNTIRHRPRRTPLGPSLSRFPPTYRSVLGAPASRDQRNEPTFRPIPPPLPHPHPAPTANTAARPTAWRRQTVTIEVPWRRRPADNANAARGDAAEGAASGSGTGTGSTTTVPPGSGNGQASRAAETQQGQGSNGNTGRSQGAHPFPDPLWEDDDDIFRDRDEYWG